MFRPVEKPRVAVLGLSLGLYREAVPGYMERLEQQLGRFVAAITPYAAASATRLCCLAEHVAQSVSQAERDGVDAILLVPVSYTASGMSVPCLLETTLPIVVWNTQEASTIKEDYSFDDLLMNHVAQGTQDVTSVLLRNQRSFGMVSGHFADPAALGRLADWLVAARTRQWAQTIRVGLLGHPFDDMNDFAIDATVMRQGWGPELVPLSIAHLAELAADADREAVRASMTEDRTRFEVPGDLDLETHERSARLEWALRAMLREHRLDALSFNFLDVIQEGRCETLPFFGVNKLMAEGFGYAGEGDVLTAAHMAQMRQLCGAATFTEIFTVDYERRRMLMMHMQECNPALAHGDAKVRLVRKEFWAPGVRPYVGMHFTLEPGPVTLTCATVEGPRLRYIAYEAQIADIGPLPQLDVPHWMVELDEPVAEFLTRYSVAGGMHHLVAAPGHFAGRLEGLAHLQGFAFTQL